ncbi:alpha/beta fold hydrolase [Streptomyces showdoensis]|uniref:Proline iminopeptidase n=1 Tax=Streptomyces showdoensis TaxID=68268 RepID=A0A2P2GE43_STREW|nr:alpha/beta fold hydrolase [Streptomyces showdoensis]KKZ69806.1 proline iminopeptidase [Streptomyces showdoensis]
MPTYGAPEAAPQRFPEIDPYDEGLLDVGDGNHVYWSVAGNPEGKPALVVHGGPGSGSSPGARRLFDPERYRIVQFDQRGCGRSTPHASDPAADLSVNTTAHLVADMERLRVHLGVDRWLLYGGSWGSTLILAYAQAHPERVTEIVIAAVTTTRRSETDWLYGGVARFFPEAHERFRAGAAGPDAAGPDAGPHAGPHAAGPERAVSGASGAAELVAAYAALMNHPDPAVREKAAADWCAWEDAVLSMEGQGTPYTDRVDATRLAFVRICSHYFAHGAFLEEGVLIRDAHRLAGIPGVLVHGRVDMGGPLTTAWELTRGWPDAELRVVERAGHLGDGETRAHLLTALERFAKG